MPSAEIVSGRPESRRSKKRENEIERRIDPGYGPVFKLIDDPRDPENAKRLEEAEKFRRDNPNGLIIRRLIVHPPKGQPNWEHVSTEERERYLAAYGRDDA